MSTAGRVGISVPGPTELPLDTASRLLRKLEAKTDAAPSRDAVQVSGTVDTTRPKGAPLTTGITLLAGASVNIAHGLGRVPIGFIPIVMTSSAPSTLAGLQNDTATLAADVQKTYGRITNTGGSTVVFAVEWR